jgi:hypothetical protein
MLIKKAWAEVDSQETIRSMAIFARRILVWRLSPQAGIERAIGFITAQTYSDNSVNLSTFGRLQIHSN